MIGIRSPADGSRCIARVRENRDEIEYQPTKQFLDPLTGGIRGTGGQRNDELDIDDQMKCRG
jgi:hypothetical protein